MNLCHVSYREDYFLCYYSTQNVAWLREYFFHKEKTCSINVAVSTPFCEASCILCFTHPGLDHVCLTDMWQMFSLE
jgi:hypothetical protein